MKKLVVMAAMALVLSSCNQEEQLSKEEVLAVIEKFDLGWESKNAALVDSVLSDQYVYFTQSGHTFDRGSLVKTAGDSIYTLQTMRRQQYTIQLEGNTAVVNTIWQGKGSYHGEAFDDNQRCSITIVKYKGEVKILSEHCTPIRPAVPVTGP